MTQIMNIQFHICGELFGIIYNKKMVKEPVDSWDILWNDKYKGNILMFDSVRDTMGIALEKLGYCLNSTDSKKN